ncbi:hypothetical protein K438DRAFT_1985101 [Mycena galopus ATCC 62051]|nr:hypothetical protein K438DRAFT_1985101 [Mycena galopus ATCC 62051]
MFFAVFLDPVPTLLARDDDPPSHTISTLSLLLTSSSLVAATTGTGVCVRIHAMPLYLTVTSPLQPGSSSLNCGNPVMARSSPEVPYAQVLLRCDATPAQMDVCLSPAPRIVTSTEILTPPAAAGTYSQAGATSCTTCPANTYSGAGVSSCTSCPVGHTCDEGSTEASQSRAPTLHPAVPAPLERIAQGVQRRAAHVLLIITLVLEQAAVRRVHLATHVQRDHPTHPNARGVRLANTTVPITFATSVQLTCTALVAWLYALTAHRAKLRPRVLPAVHQHCLRSSVLAPRWS